MNRDARDTLSFKLKVSFRGKLGRKLLSLVGRPFVRLLHFDRLRGFYLDVLSDADEDSLEKGLAVLNVALEISEDSLARIPTEGPAIVVANHPFGGIEALILATVLRSVRDDVRVVGDQLIKRTPNIKDTFILPDPLETSRPARTSRNTCIEWVKDGGLLALFPAREISHIDLKRRSIVDPKWRRSTPRMIRRTKAPVLPMFFSGYNGVLFQILGLVHYRLSGVVLPRELFSRRRKDIQIRTGSLIPFDKLKAFGRDKNMTEYLRMRTYILNNPAHGHPGAKRARRAPEDRENEFEEIARPETRSGSPTKFGISAPIRPWPRWGNLRSCLPARRRSRAFCARSVGSARSPSARWAKARVTAATSTSSTGTTPTCSSGTKKRTSWLARTGSV